MTDARSLTLSLLDSMESGDDTLDRILFRAEPQIQGLNRADRALLHALVYGVLRWQARLDWVIDHLASRPGKKIDPLVRTILRLGLFQIQHLDRIPVSAAVNTSVELAKANRRKWAAGFVNGVLRRAADQNRNLPWPDRHIHPAAFLSVYYSFPRWLIDRWSGRWGLETTERLCREINAIPRITLRTNTLSVDRPRLIAGIQNDADDVKATAYVPEGISMSALRRPLTQWTAFQSAWFQVQNEASQCIAHLVSPRPGQRVWDACAGLGTKTAHMAQLMKNKGVIQATDLSQKKLDRLAPEMRRLGVSIVKTTVLDLEKPLTDRNEERFDRILVDAPCSGTGVLQKHPDGKWRTDDDKIQANGKRQMAMLHNAAPSLKPGGLMVYAVCSMEPEEGEQVVQGFLQKHPEFAIKHTEIGQLPNGDKLLTPDGFFRTFPHRHQMDGFFAAVLKKHKS